MTVATMAVRLGYYMVVWRVELSVVERDAL